MHYLFSEIKKEKNNSSKNFDPLQKIKIFLICLLNWYVYYAFCQRTDPINAKLTIILKTVLELFSPQPWLQP